MAGVLPISILFPFLAWGLTLELATPQRFTSVVVAGVCAE